MRSGDSEDYPRRVVLDAYWWLRGTQSLRNVLHGVVAAWLSEFPNDSVIVVVPRQDVERVRRDLPMARVVGTRLWPHALSAMFAVPWVGRRARADAVLTHNFSPLFGRSRGVLIQDLMFESNPDWFTRSELLYFRWMTRAAGRAHVVFSSTDSEGRRIRRVSRARRVVTAGMGMAPELVDRCAPTETFPGLVAGNYVLTVGRLNVRKNLRMTIEGALGSGVLSPEFPLLIVGERDGAFETLPESVTQAGANGVVQFTGFVPTSQLRWLIKNCAVYVCLSLDEGFGLPPVEARLLGARVLVSDIEVFHETLRHHATFVDPQSKDAIGDAIRRAAEHVAPGVPDSGTDLATQHEWAKVVHTVRRELLKTGSSQ